MQFINIKDHKTGDTVKALNFGGPKCYKVSGRYVWAPEGGSYLDISENSITLEPLGLVINNPNIWTVVSHQNIGTANWRVTVKNLATNEEKSNVYPFNLQGKVYELECQSGTWVMASCGGYKIESSWDSKQQFELYRLKGTNEIIEQLSFEIGSASSRSYRDYLVDLPLLMVEYDSTHIHITLDNISNLSFTLKPVPILLRVGSDEYNLDLGGYISTYAYTPNVPIVVSSAYFKTNYIMRTTTYNDLKVWLSMNKKDLIDQRNNFYYNSAQRNYLYGNLTSYYEFVSGSYTQRHRIILTSYHKLSDKFINAETYLYIRPLNGLSAAVTFSKFKEIFKDIRDVHALPIGIYGV